MLEEKTCSECGMNESVCECGMDEGMGARCEACGMDESVCECGYMSEAKKKVQVRKLQRKFFVEQRPLHKK